MRNKKRAILLLIITIFLMPSMVNTASASEYAYYYFDESALTYWEHDWSKMVDGDPDTYAWTSDAPDEQYLSSTSYAGTHPAGTKVCKIELRTCAFVDRGLGHYLKLEPKVGAQNATAIWIPLSDTPSYSSWYEVIFFSPSHPWDWDILDDLECNVIAVPGTGAYGTFWCSIVEIRVTYDDEL